MFKKVHIRLTLLCAGITTIIMIIMSCSYLYVSEKNLYKNQMYSFQNDMNTISTNLEQQSVISMEWLSKMESQGNYTFFLLDNGIPFLYNTLDSSGKNVLLEECLNHYRQSVIVDAANSSSMSPYVSYHTESEFISPSLEKKYFYSVLILGRSSSSLQVIVLSSLDKLESQIEQQRRLFIIIDLVTILLLAVFSWFFTGILLKPIMENQEKQVQFVSSASHELRTPLAVILSSAECCLETDPDKKAGFLNTIINEGMRMKSLIDDMLTLSSSDNHRFSIEPAPTEMDTLIMDSYEAFDPLAKEKNLSLSVELPEKSLPLCICDKNRISQVVSILLHNAISYTPASGSSPGASPTDASGTASGDSLIDASGTVKLSLDYRRERFFISVSDSGIGISDEEKKKIFDRFYRAEKARSAKGHFGLGLSIANEIIKSHYGSLSVKDSPEGGALFIVELPRR